MTRTPGTRPSLNAIRAFEAAARLRSIKAAAEMLGVTPSAVSHQVRQLEQAVGTRLFSHRNNHIDLTPDGLRYFDSVHPALASIERASHEIRRDEALVNIRASTSFALSWLIPRLPEFRRVHPRIAVSVEACRLPITLDHGIDMAVSYARLDVTPVGATRLFRDYVRPVCHPQFLAALPHPSAAIEAVPLLSATDSDWDLHQWARLNALTPERFRVAARFDVDVAALAACRAGLGVWLASDFLVKDDIASGVLVPFGPYHSCQIGSYWIAAAKPSRRSAARFSKWLLNEVRSVQ